MTLKQPSSMDECVYFTRRAADKGKIMAWVFRELCPKCKKSMMGKPKDEKTGHAKIRASEYTCPSCAYAEEKVKYEEKLKANIMYTCPSCQKSDEIQIPFKRKKVDGVDALVFNCKDCDNKILVAKKMKDPKKKGSVDVDED